MSVWLATTGISTTLLVQIPQSNACRCTAWPPPPFSFPRSLSTCKKMRSADLYIVAAGNGSRMKASVPKALIPISEEPCLTTTLQQVGHKFRKVFLVSNILVQHQWSSYFAGLDVTYPELARLVVNLPIES